MPNWCENLMSVYGNAKDLIEFSKKIKTPKSKTDEGTLFDFNKVIPVPVDIAGTNEASNWCVEHWGTKWNAGSDVYGTKYTDRIEYIFDTAWSPPIQVYQELINKYPNLSFEFKWAEVGMDFSGRMTEEVDYSIEEGVYGEYYGGLTLEEENTMLF